MKNLVITIQFKKRLPVRRKSEIGRVCMLVGEHLASTDLASHLEGILSSEPFLAEMSGVRKINVRMAK